MPKDDYSKGYRRFRFQKDSAIDSILPPLCSYRSMREVNPLLWMRNAEHVANNITGHVYRDSGHIRRPSNETLSLHLPIILATSISAVSNATVRDDVDENDMGHASVMNTLACSLYSPTPTVTLGSATCHAVVPHKFAGIKVTSTHKLRTRQVTHTFASKKEPMKCDSQRKLQDCLFIQNGIQCFPSPTKNNRFLSTEKEKDIKDWINRSAHK